MKSKNYTLSVRLPAHLGREIDRRAAAAGQPRSAVVIDLLASLLGAQRAGATRGGLVGAGLGTVIGFFFGLPGIVLGPLAGAVIGELLYRRGLGTAAEVGLATWIALLVAAALKLALVFVMLGIFILALLW